MPNASWSRYVKEVLLVSFLFILVLVSSPSVQALSPQSPASSGDPCGFSTFGPAIQFSVCTPKSTYARGDIVLFNLNFTNISSLTFSMLFAQDYFILGPCGPNGRNCVMASGVNLQCGENPCTLPPGGTISAPFSWNTSVKSITGPIKKGAYIIEGVLQSCRIIGPGATVCGGNNSALAIVDITITLS